MRYCSEYCHFYINTSVKRKVDHEAPLQVHTFLTMAAAAEHASFPSDLPVPQDDGGARHLMGHPLPALTPLPSTSGEPVDLFLLSLSKPVLLFIYPRTGPPGENIAAEWNAIPGARGFTPNLCSVRDSIGPLRANEPDLQIFGLSTQSTKYQSEVVDRLHLPFAILSDEKRDFTQKLDLPTLEWEGQKLLKRMTLLLRGGQVTRVCYPVFPPDQAAALALPMLIPDEELAGKTS